MDINDALLNQELRVDEGVRTSPYKDTEGVLTVAIGHNLSVSPLPRGWTYPLSIAQENQLLANDLEVVFTGLNNNLPWWRTLSYARQRVLANMAFNMGVSDLMGFKKMLAALQVSNWTEAVAQMKISEWATQVGARATRLEALILQG